MFKEFKVDFSFSTVMYKSVFWLVSFLHSSIFLTLCHLTSKFVFFCVLWNQILFQLSNFWKFIFGQTGCYMGLVGYLWSTFQVD